MVLFKVESRSVGIVPKENQKRRYTLLLVAACDDLLLFQNMAVSAQSFFFC